MTSRRTSKQIYVYDEDAKFIKEHLRDELDLPTYADVVHELIKSYKNEKNEEQIQEVIQKEFAKSREEQNKLKKKMTVIGIKLAALSELSSDFYYKNWYDLEEQTSSSFVGTDCEAWAAAEKKALSKGDVWQPMTSEESKKRREELKAWAEKMIRQIDEALAKGKNND